MFVHQSVRRWLISWFKSAILETFLKDYREDLRTLSRRRAHQIESASATRECPSLNHIRHLAGRSHAAASRVPGVATEISAALHHKGCQRLHYRRRGTQEREWAFVHDIRSAPDHESVHRWLSMRLTLLSTSKVCCCRDVPSAQQR
jgi:hypothetical protein